MMQTEPPPHVLSSPSFSSYSSETFAQIAARVIHELQYDPLYHHDEDDTLFDDPWPQNDNNNYNHDDHHHPNLNDKVVDAENDDEDFEFSFVSSDPNSSPVSADDIFHNGQIKPTYPLFRRDILLNGVVSVSVSVTETKTVRRRLPLRALMFEERETASCSLSSDSSSNELEGVDAGTYCVWNPNACKKSSSTGSSSSSRRWKLRDLLLRSHSDGKVAPPRRNGSAGDGGAAAAEKDGDLNMWKLFLKPK